MDWFRQRWTHGTPVNDHPLRLHLRKDPHEELVAELKSRIEQAEKELRRYTDAAPPNRGRI